MAPLGSPIVVDGSQGEGGGGLVRTALTMAALTQQALRIDGVRTGTDYPGLDHEDLVLVSALARSCAAEVVGATFGSTSVSFLPTKRVTGLKGSLDLEADGRRRGPNVPTVLNAMLPVLARGGTYSRITLSGETYGHHSLSFDYFAHVTIPALAKLGLYASPEQELAGFGRESRGVISLDVEPSALHAVDWSVRGKLVGLRAIVATAELPSTIAARGIAHLELMASHAKVPIEAEASPVDAHTTGAFVTVWAECERGMGGATAMGQRGVRIETLAQRAFEETMQWVNSDATVDSFLADQLLVAACLAEGHTAFKTACITQRFLTSISVIKQFLPIHITVMGQVGSPGSISIRQ